MKCNIVLLNLEVQDSHIMDAVIYLFLIISLIKDIFYIIKSRFHQEFPEGQVQVVNSLPNQKYTIAECVAGIQSQLKRKGKKKKNQQYQNLD